MDNKLIFKAAWALAKSLSKNAKKAFPTALKEAYAFFNGQISLFKENELFFKKFLIEQEGEEIAKRLQKSNLGMSKEKAITVTENFLLEMNGTKIKWGKFINNPQNYILFPSHFFVQEELHRRALEKAREEYNGLVKELEGTDIVFLEKLTRNYLRLFRVEDGEIETRVVKYTDFMGVPKYGDDWEKREFLRKQREKVLLCPPLNIREKVLRLIELKENYERRKESVVSFG